MDAVAVNPLDRLWYRFGHWLREKLYERPVGFDLESGAMPPSIQAINALFEGRLLSVFLPYEVYTSEGLYKFIQSGTLQRQKERFAFALTLSTKRRLSAADGRLMQITILEALPEGWNLQCMALHSQQNADGYSSVLSIGGPTTASREEVAAVRDRVIEDVEALYIDVSNLHPEGLLRLVSQVFDRSPVEHYNEHDLLKNQIGHSSVRADVERITLSDAQGTFRELKIYGGRRFGWYDPASLGLLFPGLVGQHEFVAVASAQSVPGGYVGGFSIAEIVSPHSTGNLQTMFAQAGWIIEEVPYRAHLPLLTLMPMTLDDSMTKLLLRGRRWKRLDGGELGAMLPLPYLAGSKAGEGGASILPFKGVANAQ